MLATIVLAMSLGAADASSGSGSLVSDAAFLAFQDAGCTPKACMIPNPCDGTKPKDGGDPRYGGADFANKACMVDNLINAVEQSGANVTEGYQGLLNTDAEPITTPYSEVDGMCPVNVHWHLGSEHLSVGEYDENGVGPAHGGHRRRADGKVRQGFQCLHYDESDPKYTTPYEWKYCTNMEVGQTYEVHWPHSKGGDCGTMHQYQTPFYDGVFCNAGNLAPSTQAAIGVQSQVFVIVNDEEYYHDGLFNGMILDKEGDFGTDMAFYTGSTTGTSRDNTICSAYSPITWQVDRKCHPISASSFDQMCKDMLEQHDDMSGDVHPHGSRELVADVLAANNQESGGHARDRRAGKELSCECLEEQVCESGFEYEIGTDEPTPASSDRGPVATTEAAAESSGSSMDGSTEVVVDAKNATGSSTDEDTTEAPIDVNYKYSGATDWEVFFVVILLVWIGGLILLAVGKYTGIIPESKKAAAPRTTTEEI